MDEDIDALLEAAFDKKGSHINSRAALFSLQHRAQDPASVGGESQHPLIWNCGGIYIFIYFEISRSLFLPSLQIRIEVHINLNLCYAKQCFKTAFFYWNYG